MNLGAAASFSVLAGAAVTNVGATHLSGDLGVSPGTAITGFPAGTLDGATHANDEDARQAHSDLMTAYNNAKSRTQADSVAAELGGQRLTAGVYHSDAAFGLTGTLTLDGKGDPNAVFIFQTDAELTTAATSIIKLVDGA